MRSALSLQGARKELRRSAAAAFTAGCLALVCDAGFNAALAADAVAAGLGMYYTKPRSGSDVSPPRAAFISGEAASRAAPTSQWYSSVIFERWSEPLHAHPMTYRATEAGFELGLPGKVFSADGKSGARELRYPHVAAVTVSPVGFKPRDAKLTNFSDWLIEVSMAAGEGEVLKAVVLHGSPFSYYECSTGDVRLHLAGKPDLIADPREGAHDRRVAAFTIAGKSYAVFAPTGASWDFSQPADLVLHLPAGARYFSIAGLPDGNEATLRDFLAVAYAFPTETRAEWAYDEKASKVTTTFTIHTVAKEGENTKTLMGLYPHQWKAVTSEHPSQYGYDSIRGRIRLVPGTSFTLERRYRGFVPAWGGLEEAVNRSNVDSLLVGDLAKADTIFDWPKQQGKDTYWYGKGLGAVAQLMSVAEAEGKGGMRDELLKNLKSHLEKWFDGRHDSYFMQDATLGTFVGYPQGYQSVAEVNDHHFHYGYWLMGAAYVALHDPDWISDAKWGGMVRKLIADIATDERGRRDFPYIRNFDAYEGHSWAAGVAAPAKPELSVYFVDGNNQESSSEAINAWAGLVLLGEATGDRKLRDLGIYLYTSEIASVEQYWFDLDHQVLPPEFGKPYAAQVFGGKVAWNTWWITDPREILGINALPFTAASTYLGADPQFVRSCINALPAEEKAYYGLGIRPRDLPKDVWQDVIANYMAVADPDAALKLWDRHGEVNSGDTRSRTLYWMLSLKEMGLPDFSVTADTPLYAVFKGAGEAARTYLAYNAKSAPIHVTFSTGKAVDVPPRSLVRVH